MDVRLCSDHSRSSSHNQANQDADERPLSFPTDEAKGGPGLGGASHAAPPAVSAHGVTSRRRASRSHRRRRRQRVEHRSEHTQLAATTTPVHLVSGRV